MEVFLTVLLDGKVFVAMEIYKISLIATHATKRMPINSVA